MRPVRAKRIACVAALSAAAIAVGCGGDGDGDGVNNNADDYSGTEADVARVVDDFGNAGRNGDGATICEDIFSAELTANVERESGQTCPSEVEENLPEGDYAVEIDSLEVSGKTATVAITDQADNSSVLHLELDGSDWRIARVSPSL